MCVTWGLGLGQVSATCTWPAGAKLWYLLCFLRAWLWWSGFWTLTPGFCGHVWRAASLRHPVVTLRSILEATYVWINYCNASLPFSVISHRRPGLLALQGHSFSTAWAVLNPRTTIFFSVSLFKAALKNYCLPKLSAHGDMLTGSSSAWLQTPKCWYLHVGVYMKVRSINSLLTQWRASQYGDGPWGEILK